MSFVPFYNEAYEAKQIETVQTVYTNGYSCSVVYEKGQLGTTETGKYLIKSDQKIDKSGKKQRKT